MSDRPPRTLSWAAACWLAGYTALVAVVLGTLVELRRAAIDPAGRAENQQHWQAWRDDVPKLNAEGTVRRSVPKSAEPPGLVLLRDHFPVVLAAAVLFTSLLYAVLAILIRGAFSARGRPPGATARR